MVITRANIIGTVTRTIIGDIVPTTGTTTTHTGITATPVVRRSALVSNSIDSGPYCIIARRDKCFSG